MPHTGRLDPELIARLAALVEDYQLLELIETIEAINVAGKGWGRVVMILQNSSMTDLEGQFTRKPRPNQSGLISRRSEPDPGSPPRK